MIICDFIKKIFIFSKKDQKNAIFYALDAETERKTGNPKKALNIISKAIKIEPDNDMFYVTRALINKDLKKYNTALKDITKALELNASVERTKIIKNEIEMLIK